MDIKDVREETVKIQFEISNIINKFEKMTGLLVNDIEVYPSAGFSSNTTAIKRIGLTVELN